MAMTTGKKIGIGVVVLAVLALGAFALLRGNADDSTKNDTAATSGTGTDEQSDTTDTATDDTTQAAATITYDDDGFSPAVTTVEAGDKVAIKNSSSNTLSFHSDPHPAHTTNAELNVDLVKVGETKTFTVTKKGTFGFHDHFAPNHTGKLTVE